MSTQEVGRSLTLVTAVTREFSVVATNRLPGAVTAVEDLHAIGPGDTLYSVEQIPVRAVAGDLPFYRDLDRGDEGEDVAQLQDALRALGLLSGPSDGRFGSGTERAVEKWQEELGLEETGEIPLGRLVAIPQLPGPVRVDSSVITPGLVLAGGEPVISVPGDHPEFVMHLSTAQADLIPNEATLTVISGEHSWPAVIASSAPGDQGTDLTLTAPGGSAVCGADCGSLSGAESSNLMTQVEIVPAVTGPAIPLSAITTETDGRTTVERADGTEIDVTVEGIEDGIATVGVIRSLDSTEVVLARAPATDVVNAATGSGGPIVPLWEVHGDLTSAVTLVSGRWPHPGEAVISQTAREVFGLAVDTGAAQLGQGRQIPIVGTFRAEPAFATFDAGVLAVAGDVTALTSVDVLASSLADVEAAQTGTLEVLSPRDPQQVAVDSPLSEARTAMDLDAQLARTSRMLLVTVLGIGLLLIGAVVLADVLIRAGDLGRRRTLGITRTDLVVLVSLRAGAAAIPGVAVAVAATLALGQDLVDVSARVAVPIGLLTLDAVLLAAIPPALLAAYRDPVRVMRVA